MCRDGLTTRYRVLTALLNSDTSHLKGNHKVAFFGESIVQIAVVHACIGCCADCSDWRVQAVNFGDHVLLAVVIILICSPVSFSKIRVKCRREDFLSVD